MQYKRINCDVSSRHASLTITRYFSSDHNVPNRKKLKILHGLTTQNCRSGNRGRVENDPHSVTLNTAASRSSETSKLIALNGVITQTILPATMAV